MPVGASDIIYTCPMHPEMRQVGPGSCPICGMALEPETVSAKFRAEAGSVAMAGMVSMMSRHLPLARLA